MKIRIVLILTIFLFGCQNSIQTNAKKQSSQNLDTKSEYMKFTVPTDSKIGYEAYNSSLHIVEYIKNNESVHKWTAMITLLALNRSSHSDIDEFFRTASDRLRSGCAVEAIVESPRRFVDGPHPAGMQTAICGRTKSFGQGEILIYKMIEGKYGFYQLQYAWRVPPVADSREITLPEQARKGAAELLAQAHLCDREQPRPEC
ncbi:hypothetical protein [Inquilinus sp. Marseille-Q2685]|uniref:hypothetical protein n=1 Tax=Inquilinus sp. Marseille-Q2685 TaxID=2866581 RepID=UPI001CE3B83C|nr:hypothetical protein [Inquilinus sp. Marseille-Q2685]